MDNVVLQHFFQLIAWESPLYGNVRFLVDHFEQGGVRVRDQLPESSHHVHHIVEVEALLLCVLRLERLLQIRWHSLAQDVGFRDERLTRRPRWLKTTDQYRRGVHEVTVSHIAEKAALNPSIAGL